MSRRDREDMRRRIAELNERRKREAEEQKRANRAQGNPPPRNAGPVITEPPSPPRARPTRGTQEEPLRYPIPNSGRMYSVEDPAFQTPVSDSIPTVIPRAHLNFHGRMPEPTKADTSRWNVGRETRKLHVHPDKTMTGEIDRQKSNLDHMIHIADREFDDAKHYRETVAKMHMKSEKRMYDDMEKQRKYNEQMQSRHEMLKWRAEEQKRIAEAKALSEAQGREYLDRERERNAKFKSQLLTEEAEFKKVLHNNKLRMAEQKAQWKHERAQQQAELQRQREEHEAKMRYRQQEYEAEKAKLREEQHRRDLEFQREIEENKRREQAHREEMQRQREHERAMREAEAQARQQQNLQEQYMVQMEYGDRERNRNHQRDVELGALQLANADRNAERQYNLAQTKLVRATELGNVYNTLMNSMQQRYFNDLAFRDARVGRHRNYVKVAKEQRGIDRETEVLDIFDEFDMGDPDMLDLSERRISPQKRRLKHSNCHSYLHSYLFTGVESIVQKEKADPYVLFIDGTRKTLPSWGDGYVIQPRMIRPYVWIIDVYKVPTDMVDKSDRKRKPKKDDEDDFDWEECGKMFGKACGKLCEVQ